MKMDMNMKKGFAIGFACGGFAMMMICILVIAMSR